MKKINQKVSNFLRLKEDIFKKNGTDQYNWLHYDEKLDAAFCHICMQAKESKILNTPWKDDTFVTKGFRKWKKALYIEKNKHGTFEKHNYSDSHKSAVERYITVASKDYGKVPEILSTSTTNEQRENQEMLLKILENIKFLGKSIYLLNIQEFCQIEIRNKSCLQST